MVLWNKIFFINKTFSEKQLYSQSIDCGMYVCVSERRTPSLDVFHTFLFRSTNMYK